MNTTLPLIKLTCIFATAWLALAPAAFAQCPQKCEGNNTAVGYVALESNTTGVDNVAIGTAALFSNTTGNDNIAIGFSVIQYNTIGSFNIAIGTNVMNLHDRGNANVAIGHFAMDNDVAGKNNVALGQEALHNNQIGVNNTALGSSALHDNTTGGYNIGIGVDGGGDLTTGRHNIDIGNPGVAGESNTIRIGAAQNHTATYIAGISGATVPTGVGVIIDPDGHLGTTTSSARYKEAIKPMKRASEAILSLKPVTFRYKHELDPEAIPQFGLVAEEVAKLDPDLVVRDEEGKPYSVRYEAVNAMLLNEFLKEHRKVETLEKVMAEQQKENESMRAMLKEQATQIQAVSAALQRSKPSPRLVANNL